MDSEDEALKDVAAKARVVPLWSDYADFCTKLERGLRTEAFATLERFIFVMERLPFEERRRFVSWLSGEADGQWERLGDIRLQSNPFSSRVRPAIHEAHRYGRKRRLIPHPLYVRLVEPTLLEWTLIEPLCSEPHLWLGYYDHLKRAIELDPDCQLARGRLIILILKDVGDSSHELPQGYLGDVKEDLAALGEAEELLSGLSNEEDHAILAADIAEQRRLIEDYLGNQ